jgi:hypothetical protein
MTDPIPSNTKKICIVNRFGAKKFPMAETTVTSAPTSISDLYLTRTTMTLSKIEKTNSPAWLTVASWLATPTGTLKAAAISTMNNVNIVVEVDIAAVAIIIAGITSLSGDLESSADVPLLRVKERFLTLGTPL